LRASTAFFHDNGLLSIAAGTIHISGAHGQHALSRLHGDTTADARLQSCHTRKRISDCRKQWLGLMHWLPSQALTMVAEVVFLSSNQRMGFKGISLGTTTHEEHACSRDDTNIQHSYTQTQFFS
jgi:hypothetical protein